MSVVTPPPLTSPLVDANGVMTPAWAQWIMQAYRVNFASQQSGTTAQRPTKDLYAGRMYFDTSLSTKGKAIWRNKDATGWVDGSGASV